jgi:hypothetical protein
VEFGLPDEQTIGGDIVEAVCEAFGDPHAGCRDKTEKSCLHQWPDRVRPARQY